MSSKNKGFIVLTAVAVLALSACSRDDNTPQTRALSPDGFDDHLRVHQLQNASSERKAQARAELEKRLRWVAQIESSDSVDVALLDADMARIRTDRLIGEYLENQYTQHIDEDAIQAYYKANQDTYVKREEHVAHILLRLPAGSSEEEKAAIRTTGQEALARLHRGDAFEDVAEAFSDDENSVSRGGELGWVRPGILPDAVFASLDTLDVGQNSDILEASYGLHIVKKLDASRTEPLSLSRARPRIVKALRAQIKQDALAQLDREQGA